MSIVARVEPAKGVEERLEHVQTPRGLVYSWTARPPEARSCVLVCSSVFGDFTSNYHRERLLGLTLASRGHGVIRFHYTGEGNSQGERRDITFSSLCEDAQAVLEHGMSLGFRTFALVGTRVGALVAAATVAPTPSIPLALWEPVVDPLGLILEAQRARRMSQLAKEGSGQAPDWRQELEQNGVLDLLGYDVYPALVDSFTDVDLLTTLGSHGRPVFIARFSGRTGAADPVADELIKRGCSVESGTFQLSESWWFHSERVPESGDLITETTAWLTSVLSELM